MRTNTFLLKTILLISLIISCSISEIKKPETNHIIFLSDYSYYSDQDNPCLKLFMSIEKYSEQYSIPRHIMYNIAFLETRYQGPFHWNYVPNLGSYSGALGPMQIMLSTARFIRKEKVSSEKLKNDIDFNVETSAKVLSYLFSIYKDWGRVCGAYNTGRPIINKYAKFCKDNLLYWSKWEVFSGEY